MPVVSVESAEDGLALLEQRNRDGSPHPFGLVILDWLLPGMNGIDAAARIRTRAETRALPIIMISAYAGKEEEARCAELGVNRLPSEASDGVLDVRRGRRVTGRPRPRPRGASSTRRSSVSSQACRRFWPRTTRPTRWSRSSFWGAWGSTWTWLANGREAIAMAAGRTGEVRSNPDGHADARARRAGGDACPARRSALHDGANHRDDGERDEGRPRRVSCRGHERLRHQADRPPDARRDAAALAAAHGRRSRPSLSRSTFRSACRQQHRASAPRRQERQRPCSRAST